MLRQLHNDMPLLTVLAGAVWDIQRRYAQPWGKVHLDYTHTNTNIHINELTSYYDRAHMCI